MNLLTFLGTTNYTETTYVWGDQKHTSRYCAAALAHFFQPQTTLIVVTRDACAKHFESLADEIHALTKPVEVRIPDGKNEAQLWQVFDALTSQVVEGSSLVADITNGFRSLPFLSFLAVAYLRAAKQVTVQSVLYGAYEARNEQNESPVFDLTPFVTLLDWLTASDQFIKTGNALSLARLLHRAGTPALDGLAGAVGDISLGLRLLRPIETSLAAHRLPDRLRDARRDLPPPFAVLSDRVARSYGLFALPPDGGDRDRLACQLRMIVWYYGRGQIVHCLSLAREWMISLLCYHFQLDALDKGSREEMEFLIGGGKDARGDVSRVSPYLDRWSTVPDGKVLRALWLKQPCNLRELRNDVLHSGFRRGARPAQEIVETTELIVNELLSIARTWGLSPAEGEEEQPREAPAQ